MHGRFPQSEELSPDELAFAAPLFTPLFSLLGFGITLPGSLTPFDLALVLPAIAIVSVVVGYVGLFFVCIPVMALLLWARRLDAVRLCLYTTMLGAELWAACSVYGRSSLVEWPELLSALSVGAFCSFGVTAAFCLLGKIPMRTSNAG
jgi:hypothetical protein